MRLCHTLCISFSRWRFFRRLGIDIRGSRYYKGCMGVRERTSRSPRRTKMDTAQAIKVAEWTLAIGAGFGGVWIVAKLARFALAAVIGVVVGVVVAAKELKKELKG